MDRRAPERRTRRPLPRRLIQLYAALLYNAHLKGFVQGDIFKGKTKALCVPGLNCYSCPGAVGACPLGALQNALADSAHRPAFYAVGVLLLFGLLLGRTVCGWLCPFGLLQELLHKLPGPKLKKSRFTRTLSWGKYGLLAILVLAVPLGAALRGDGPLPAFCKYLCPAGTLEGALPLLLHPANEGLRGLLGALFHWKLLALMGILAACVFVYRAFCRFLCPLGALYSLTTRLALIGVRLDEKRCTDCGLCRRVCPVDIRQVGDRECVACGKCVERCPVSAITIRAGKLVLMGPVEGGAFNAARKASPIPGKRRRILAWGLALLVLVGALAYANLPLSAQAETVPAGTEAPELGSAVGQRLPDFRVETLDGGSFTLSAQRGRPVVLNLWATWCAPCVKELPIFEAFAAEHPDAAVLAIHSGLVTEDVAAWVAEKGYALPFALDESGALTAQLGASAVLPHTLVLDRDGTVLYNAPGSVTRELLEALYQSALEESAR